MRTKEIKNKNGITLISLIVTIIVILILAGITISTLFGENRNYNQNITSKKTNTSSKWKRSNRITNTISSNAKEIRFN